MRRFCGVVALISMLVQSGVGQTGWLKPPFTLVLDGVPNIPASIGTSILNYQAAFDDVLVGWDPARIEPVFLRRYNTGAWILCSSETPGGPASHMRPLPPRTHAAYQNPRRRYFVFQVDASAGAELLQLYGYDSLQNSVVLLTDGASKNYYPLFSNSGDTMMYSSTRRTGKHMDVYVTNVVDPKNSRMVAKLEGEDWQAFDWSPDDRKVILSENRMSGETNLWLLDVASGTKTCLTDAPQSGVVFNGSHAQFSKDATGIYHVTDRDSEFRRLAYFDIATKRETYLSGNIGWDVEEFALSPDRRLLAFTSNENGFSRLHILDISKKNQELRLPDLPAGVINQLSWHSSGEYLAFGFSSGTVPGDIYCVQIRQRKLQVWTRSARSEIGELPKPEPIAWRSFDGKSIPGFLYLPPTKFAGRRPVIISVHGGPSSQYRPGFREADNYFTFELGVAMIYPNIRGSTGYGKSYLESDNGYHREDAIKDIGALFDWIRNRPELDADRVLIKGDSYGGYAALSVAANYGTRIIGSISDSGPSNLATVLERTDVSRQDRRRAEYGDERDPNVRKFLESIAPFNRADRVHKPLLVIQGKNDSRVPYSESEQMVAAVRKNRTAVWYVLALNEGHAFSSVRNIHFSLCVQIFFTRSLLAGELVSH